MRVGLALGGGGARGLAHLGVLNVLGHAGVPITAIAGTSFGAVVGGLYALTPDPKAVSERVLAFLSSQPFRHIRTQIMRSRRGIALRTPGLISERAYLRLIASLVHDEKIEELELPFAAVATDLIEGNEVVLRAGPLRRAIAASSALPGVFPPVRIAGRLLVDGGWVNVIPVEAIQAAGLDAAGVDAVIAVHPAERARWRNPLRNGLEVLRRANDITRNLLGAYRLREADVVIQPQVGDVVWSEFDRAEECITRGEEAARRSLPAIMARLKRQRRRERPRAY